MKPKLYRGQARAVHKPGVMNNLETLYAGHLEAKLLRGEIRAYDFEPVKLRLADNTFYAPDFRVVRNDYAIEYHEVKGHWEDDARVKIKVAASLHPYIFRAFTAPSPGTWVEERFMEEPVRLTAAEAAHVKLCDVVNRLSQEQLVQIATAVVGGYFEGSAAAALVLHAAGVDLEAERNTPF